MVRFHKYHGQWPIKQCMKFRFRFRSIYFACLATVRKCCGLTLSARSASRRALTGPGESPCTPVSSAPATSGPWGISGLWHPTHPKWKIAHGRLCPRLSKHKTMYNCFYLPTIFLINANLAMFILVGWLLFFLFLFFVVVFSFSIFQSVVLNVIHVMFIPVFRFNIKYNSSASVWCQF